MGDSTIIAYIMSMVGVFMAISMKEKRTRPFLRWAGGKAWFIDYLSDLIANNSFTDYYEPFIGGGSIFFSLAFQNANIILSDSNQELIDTYIAVRDMPEQVISSISKYQNTSEFYYLLRETIPTTPAEKAARFIFLNHTSYNGLYRVNQKGLYNVPYGHRAKVEINPSVIRDASAALKGVTLLSQDFAECSTNITKGSLVFLDPPYTVSHNNNGFIAYNKKIFSVNDQRRLATCIDTIQKKGAYFILTNAAHDSIKEIFKNCGTCTEVKRHSLIGGKGATRGKTEELVFTNIEKR